MRYARVYFIILSTFAGAFNALAQSGDVVADFDKYKTKYPASRMHLVFNQPYYAPGDTIFFSAWHLGESHKLMPGRQVASLDLLAENGRAVDRIHFKVEEGRATNQIILPKDIAPGSYTIAAYTDWMRNFSQDWFFQKRIEIKGRNEITPAVPPMTAGVEGGSLVSGIVNHVVVVTVPGALVSIRTQAGEDVTSVTADSTGVASMSITPRSGSQYLVSGPAGSKTQLPAVKESGVSINWSGNDEVFVVTASEQLADKQLTVVFASAGKIVDARKLTLQNGSSTVNLPSMLKGVFHQLYIFDAKGNLVGERVFTKDASVPSTGTLSAAVDVFQRQNVSLAIELPSAADLSITAYQQKLFDTHSLKNSFYLSELPAVLQWAETYSNYEKSLNTFLVTQSWSRINWTEIFSDEPKKMPFPYYSILTEKGKVVSRMTGSPVPDSTLVIVYLQKNTMGYETYTRDGRFEVPFAFDFWETDYLFVTLQRRSRDLDKEYQVVIDPDSIRLPAILKGKQLATESIYGNYAFNKQLISGSYSFFSKEIKNTDDDRGPNAVFEDELGDLSYEVNVEKYVVFPLMEDLLREIVPFVQYRKKGAAEGVRMLFRYQNNSKLSKGSPTYVVDGVMTRSSEFFMGLKPKDILTVKIANDPNRLQQLGKIGENGFVLVQSRKGTIADSLRQATNIPVTGLNPVLSFHNASEVKATTQRIPDLRSTLFWNGRASADNTGKTQVNLVTGDDVGVVKVIIQGLTPDGVPIFLERDVNVKFRRQQ